LLQPRFWSFAPISWIGAGPGQRCGSIPLKNIDRATGHIGGQPSDSASKGIGHLAPMKPSWDAVQSTLCTAAE